MTFAYPAENVTSDKPLYQQVKHLETYGLLDPQDQAVLDEGHVVTRLELALYTEKAKKKLKSKTASSSSTPTSSPASGSLLQSSSAVSQPAAISSAMAAEIDNLLKQLDAEAEYLTTRMALDDYRIKQQETEVQKLNEDQDLINSSFRKSNKAATDPHYILSEDTRVENFSMSGITQVSATSAKNEFSLQTWGSLGGRGSFNMGILGSVYAAVANGQPVSLYLLSPTVNFNMDGMLGHWSNTLAVETYTYDTDLGDFTRGAYPGYTRFEDPFDIKRYSSDKNMRNWDDYMNNLGYVPSFNSWSSQNNTTKVFDGLYMIGTNLPLVSKDAKMTLLFGRMDPSGSDVLQPGIPLTDYQSSPGAAIGNYTERWEEGLKYSQPLPGGIQLSLSSIWVNDNFGAYQSAPVTIPAVVNSGVTITAPVTTTTAAPSLDLRNFAGDIAVDLKPAFLDVEAGFSHLYSGYYSTSAAAVTSYQPNTSTPQALEAGAGQASLSLYPLTLYYTAISDGYANTDSKVLLSGVQFWQYGFYNGYPGGPYNNSTPKAANASTDQYGFIGMVDDLISDRYGWRANLGWRGRQETWTKFLPDFFDDMVINLDVAQKTEYSAVSDEQGFHDVEAYDLITVLYPDDLGLFGGSIWDGYGGIHPAGQQYVDNIENLRSGAPPTDFAYDLRFSGLDSERIPMILPANSVSQVLPAGSAPQRTVSGTTITTYYADLNDLKTFNYITLTAKLQLNKMFQLPSPLYGSFFFTDHEVSGSNPAYSSVPDPYRLSAGGNLGNIPNMFEQTAYDAALLFGVVKNVNLLADYGLETWKSNYTYPLVDYRTEVFGAGLAYDVPWGGGKFEFRYKHIDFTDKYVPASNYQADQYYAYFLFQF